MAKTTISRGGQPIPAAYAGVDPDLRARLHRRFPHAPHWAPIREPTPPWEVIYATLAKGMADGLGTLQLAGGVYAVLASHGLLTEARA